MKRKYKRAVNECYVFSGFFLMFSLAVIAVLYAYLMTTAFFQVTPHNKRRFVGYVGIYFGLAGVGVCPRECSVQAFG